MSRFAAPVLALSISLVLAACTARGAWNTVPESLVDVAELRGYTDIRFWGDEPPENIDNIIAKKLSQTSRRYDREGLPRSMDYLSISGGGANGAFGAGLLVGWAKQGTRPTFDVVTGISAGALIAPFAFLGPEYDNSLQEVFTTISTKDVLRVRGLGGLLGGTALADSGPLLNVISKYVDGPFLDEVARQHSLGRRLFVGTANLEAKRSVVWDMGEIAASNAPDRVALFRNILLASSSIPGAFPPVPIDVVANGTRYQEIHADGGTVNQLFLYPTRFQSSTFKAVRRTGIPRRLYIIRNGKLDPDWQELKRSTKSIASVAISTLIESQGRGDIVRLYGISKRDGMEFNLVSIPSEFKVASREPFDKSYMRQLFAAGYSAAASGDTWQNSPPDF
jgi:predicted acylesterase/phospholipase RssA